MAGIGGYQAPAHPAAVSGVGKASRRTDGGPVQKIMQLPNANYGDNKAFVQEQRSAPLAAGPTAALHSPAAAPAPAGMPGNDPSSLVSLTAPSERPNEPVTAGAATGPGPGVAALNLPNPQVQAAQNAKQFVDQLAQSSGNPAVQYLAANIRGSF